jgi:hypothetical protein
VLGRTTPIRLGGRYGTLPFHADAEQTSEWALSLGLGAQPSRPGPGPLALGDLAIERGRRGDQQVSRLSEDFWRFTFAITVFGN